MPCPPISRRKLLWKFSPSKVSCYMVHAPQNPVGLLGYLTPTALYPSLVTFSTVGIAIQTCQHQPSLPAVNIYLYFHNQFHHFHQCNFYSHHNVWRRWYTDHCRIEMLHFDKNLYKLNKASSDIASIIVFMSHELATIKILTAVSLITSIRAWPESSASWGGGDTLAIGTLKLTEAT